MDISPGKPPYSKSDLHRLDVFHQWQGDYVDWMLSSERADIAGPTQIVRVINWKNLKEVCERSGLNQHEMEIAYLEAVRTGDILFAIYEEE